MSVLPHPESTFPGAQTLKDYLEQCRLFLKGVDAGSAVQNARVLARLGFEAPVVPQHPHAVPWGIDPWWSTKEIREQARSLLSTVTSPIPYLVSEFRLEFSSLSVKDSKAPIAYAWELEFLLRNGLIASSEAVYLIPISAFLIAKPDLSLKILAIFILEHIWKLVSQKERETHRPLIADCLRSALVFREKNITQCSLPTLILVSRDNEDELSKCVIEIAKQLEFVMTGSKASEQAQGLYAYYVGSMCGSLGTRICFALVRKFRVYLPSLIVLCSHRERWVRIEGAKALRELCGACFEWITIAHRRKVIRAVFEAYFLDLMEFQSVDEELNLVLLGMVEAFSAQELFQDAQRMFEQDISPNMKDPIAKMKSEGDIVF